MSLSHAQRQQATARLEFLDAASHLLIRSCPTVSAQLQLDFSDVAFDVEKALPQSKRHEACGRCGTTMQPDNSKVSIHTHCRKPKGLNEPKITSKSLVTECLTCGNKTRSELPRSQPHRKKSIKVELPTAIPKPSIPKSLLDGESKTSRKQKQKEKKKQGSLQAMLTKSKQESSNSSLGLCLMDLMKGT
jgi:hypothetical protein